MMILLSRRKVKLRRTGLGGNRRSEIERRRLRRPRIVEHQAAFFEVAGVAGRKGRLTRADDASNLDITNLDGTANTASLRGDPTGGLGGGLVEGQHSAFKFLFERLCEGLFQLAPSLACREDLQA